MTRPHSTVADSTALPGEFDRIARYFRPLATGLPGALELRDDAALLALPADEELVVTTDAMVAGVHFFPDDPPDDIAAKLLRVNLSDLAAMGATPYAYTLVTVLPRTVGANWLAAFAAGLKADQVRYGIHLAGGDSVSTAGPVVLMVTAFGRLPTGQAILRSGARPGDDLYVSGSIGDAALGLRLEAGTLRDVATTDDRQALIARLRRPEPRLSLGQALRGVASAAADISDGLLADVGHIASASGVAVVLEAARVPLSPAARRLFALHHSESPTLVLSGGDDYELVFTAPPDHARAVSAAASLAGVPVQRIGHITATSADTPAGAVTVLDSTGIPLPLTERGWSHW